MRRVRIHRLLAGATLFLLAAATLHGQTPKIKGTTENAFTLGKGATKLTVTNSSGVMSLSSGLTVSGGTVNFTGASFTPGTMATVDINGGTIDGTVIGGSATAAGSFTSLNLSSQLQSSLTTGTAPFSVASTTKVASLNVEQTDGVSLATGGTGGLVYQSASTTLTAAAAGTTGHMAISGGSGAPTWLTLTSAQILVGNSSNVPAAVAMSGNATISNTGVLTIGADQVAVTMINQGTAGQVLMSNATPTTTWTTVGGDITASSSGTFTIANAAVGAAKLDVNVADILLSSSIAAGAEAANVIRVTYQVLDGYGGVSAETYLVGWNISDSSGAASETAQAPTVAYVSGAAWQSVTANKKALAFTDNTGKLVVDVTLVGDLTVHFVVGGAVANKSQTLDFN